HWRAHSKSRIRRGINNEASPAPAPPHAEGPQDANAVESTTSPNHHDTPALASLKELVERNRADLFMATAISPEDLVEPGRLVGPMANKREAARRRPPETG